MNEIAPEQFKAIMDSLGDGVYACDSERRIVFWSASAERITGWSAEDVVGRHCFDNILCHVDKDGHRLCGREHCPLHRAMITDQQSKGALLVYAQGKHGERIPMQVSVSPMHDAEGNVTGGVETFRDASETIHDLERAKAIQQTALTHEIAHDERVEFTAHYVPQGIVGGDFYAIQKIDGSHYALILADITGHGIAAALYTMHLSQLWDRHHHLMREPVEFAAAVNNDLARLVKGEASFATAICGLVDVEDRWFRFASAGGPRVLLVHADGSFESLESSGLPLAVMEDALFEETRAEIEPGDRLLLFSDGVTEIHNAQGQMLETDGVVSILKSQGYPDRGLDIGALEEALLKYSNSIRLEDDLTMIEARFKAV
jgi:PAS domain S-box-containing protein